MQKISLKVTRFIKIGLIIFLIISLIGIRETNAQTDDEKLRELNDKIAEYTTKIEESRGKQKTLASAITLITNQMNLKI